MKWHLFFCVAIQTFFLSASTEHCQVYDNAPCVTVNLDNQANDISRGGIYWHVGVRACSSLPKFIPMRSIVSDYGSLQLNHYFDTNITPTIFAVTTGKHVDAVPGYRCTYGLRECFIEPSAFASHDEPVIMSINNRLDSYHKRIEDIVFDTQGLFKESLSKKDLIRAGAKFGTDIMLFNGVAKFMSSIARNSMPMILKCIRKGSRSVEVAITAEGIPVRCAKELNSLMSTMQNTGGGATGGMAKQTVKEAEAIAEVAKGAKELVETFNISKYDPSIGDLSKLEEAIEMFKNTEGALSKDGPLFKALQCGLKATQNKLGTARGAMYELETAVELARKGEKIIYLGESVNGSCALREFDISTKNALIECKDVDWTRKNASDWNKIYTKFGDQLKIAKEKGKIFEVYSKQPIPHTLKNWFRKMGINFFEG